MKSIGSLLLVFLIAAGCTRQSVKLPTLPISGITDTIYDNSQIWIFFKVEDGDTTAVLNRKNSISTTSWILNIDRRLPMELVAAHLDELMKKREKPSMHPKDADDHNYFSYVNTNSNLLSLVKFDTLYIKSAKPEIKPKMDTTEIGIQIDQSLQHIKINDEIVEKTDLATELNHLIGQKRATLYFSFDGHISYADYLGTKAILQAFNKEKVRLYPVEYMY